MSIFSKLIEYLRSSKHELTKVTWPSRQETIRYSSLVIIISVGVAVFFGLMDFGLGRLMNATLVKHAVENQVPGQDQPVIPNTVPLNPDGAEQPTFDYGDIQVESSGGEVQVLSDEPTGASDNNEQPANENQ